MKVKRPARKAPKPKVAGNVRDSVVPHVSPRAKPPVKKAADPAPPVPVVPARGRKLDRPSPEPANGPGADPAPPKPASVDVEPIEGLVDLAGELAGVHAAIKKLLGSKKTGRVSRKAAFLAAFVQSCSITRSAAAAGVCREMHYEWLDTDRKYRAAFDLAREKAGDILEDEAVRRAHQGTLKPVYYVGQLCGAIREYSDGLLQMLLKGARPERYREKVDVRHNKGDGWSGTGSEAMALYRELTMKGEA